jgi:hypothetical protein
MSDSSDHIGLIATDMNCHLVELAQKVNLNALASFHATCRMWHEGWPKPVVTHIPVWGMRVL